MVAQDYYYTAEDTSPGIDIVLEHRAPEQQGTSKVGK